MGTVIFLIVVVTIVAYACYLHWSEWRLFKDGNNPYQRICKRCGSHQHQYRSNIEGREHIIWWQEVYTIGNDPDCECHQYNEEDKF